MKRIFIAIKVDAAESLLSMMTSLKSGLANESVKWTRIDNIHITLVFLGDTDEGKISGIRSMLKEVCAGSGKFYLSLKGCGVFRNLNDPRILWTGIDHSDKLAQLNEIIVNGLKKLSIKMEDRPYNPHLTIGRIKDVSDRDLLKSLLDRFENSKIQTVPVNEVILYESTLLQTGPVYQPIEKFDL